MNILRKSLAMAGAILCTLPVQAQDDAMSFSTGNGYYAKCSSKPAPFINGVCYGYLDGAMDTTYFYSDKDLGYCIPTGSTNQQSFDIFIGYLRDNPSKRHLPTTYLVRLAMIEAFPCPTP